MAELDDEFVKKTGYVDTFFYNEAPNYIHLISALTSPNPLRGNLNICDLGSGTGNNTYFNALCNPRHVFYGYDYSQSAIDKSIKKAKDNKVKNIHYQCSDFETLATSKQEDIPQFDIIYAHGIFSWISSKNHHHLLNFVKRFLAPHGILYLCYNTHPGRSYDMCLRPLLKAFASELDKDDPDLVKKSIDQVGALLRNPDFLRYEEDKHFILSAYPKLKDKIEEICNELPAPYVAHEYMADDYHVFSFGEIVDLLKDYNLHFCASTYFDRNIFNIQSAIHTSSTPVFDNMLIEQTVKDFTLNTTLRKDCFSRLPSAEKADIFKNIQDFTFATPVPTHKLKIKGFDNSENLQKMGRDFLELCVKPKTFKELHSHTLANTYSWEDILAFICILINQHVLVPSGYLTNGESEFKDQHRKVNAQLIKDFKFENDDNLVFPAYGNLISLSVETAKLLQKSFDPKRHRFNASLLDSPSDNDLATLDFFTKADIV